MAVTYTLLFAKNGEIKKMSSGEFNSLTTVVLFGPNF